MESIIRFWQSATAAFLEQAAAACIRTEIEEDSALETLYKVLIGLCVVFVAAGIYYLS